MDSVRIQQWQVAYLAVAVLCALATVVAAHRLRVASPLRPAAEGALAVIVGAFWPLMGIGLMQLWALHLVDRRLRDLVEAR